MTNMRLVVNKLIQWLADSERPAVERILHIAQSGADLDHDIPIKPDTPFHVASVSKQFTAFAILLLAQQGKLSLDDKVQKYITELREFDQPITIRHLLHHTSGLRDQWNPLIMSGRQLVMAHMFFSPAPRRRKDTNQLRWKCSFGRIFRELALVRFVDLRQQTAFAPLHSIQSPIYSTVAVIQRAR